MIAVKVMIVPSRGLIAQVINTHSCKITGSSNRLNSRGGGEINPYASNREASVHINSNEWVKQQL